MPHFRVGASVKQVSHDVEMIHRKALDKIRQGLDELIAVLDPDDGVKNTLVIRLLVVPLVRKGMKQLVDDIGKFLRHGLSHLGTGVLGRKHPGDLHHLPQRLPVPLGRQLSLPLRLHDADLVARIIDQRPELPLLFFSETVPEDHLDLLADHAGAVVHDMEKGFILSVDVAHEMFRALGQVHDGREVDDLCAHRLPVRIFFRKQLKILKILSHDTPPL